MLTRRVFQFVVDAAAFNAWEILIDERKTKKQKFSAYARERDFNGNET